MTFEVSVTCDECGAELARLSFSARPDREALIAVIRDRVPPETTCPDCGATFEPPEAGELIDVPDAPPPR